MNKDTTNNSKSKALGKYRIVNKSGGYTDARGTRHLTREEQEAKMSKWSKASGKGSPTSLGSGREDSDYQRRFGRAYND